MLNFFAEKMWVAFALQKLLTFFSAKNIRILYIESARTVNEMTLNELVKLTTLWTTGPSSLAHNKVITVVDRIHLTQQQDKNRTKCENNLAAGSLDWLQSFLQLSFFITSYSCICLFYPILLFYYRNFSTKGHNLSNHYKLY